MGSLPYAPRRSTPFSTGSSSRRRLLLLVWCIVTSLQLASAAIVPSPVSHLPCSLPSPSSYPLLTVERSEPAEPAFPQMQRQVLALAEAARQNEWPTGTLRYPEEADKVVKRASTSTKKTSSTKKVTSSTKKTTSSSKKTTSSTKKTTSSTKKTTSSSTRKVTSTTKKSTVISSTSTKKTTSSTGKATSSTGTAQKPTSSSTKPTSNSSSTATTKTSQSTTSTKLTSVTSGSSTSSTTAVSLPTASLASSNLHLLIQNNLNWATLDQHPGYLLSETPSNYTTASIACAGLSEKLARPDSTDEDLRKQLSYLIFKGVLSSGQSIWTRDRQLLVLSGEDGSYTIAKSGSDTAKYSVLCTQSAPRRTAYTTDTSNKWHVRVKTPAGSLVTGYRDGLSFRFHAIRYASTPLRFAYSTVDTTARVINATVTGTSKQCPQAWGTYSEDCLVLSIWTNYLPGAAANSSILVSSIDTGNDTTSSATTSTGTSSGGATSVTTLTSTVGTAEIVTSATETTSATDASGATAATATTPTTEPIADPTAGSTTTTTDAETVGPRHIIGARATDNGLRPIMVWLHGGGNVVGTGLDPAFDGGQMASRGDVVVITINYRLGTLGALPISDTLTGNYGLQDVVTALKWLQTNAATFGGDASQITLFGQSSGANLIQALLGNPTASGLFHKVIIQSGRPADNYSGALAPNVSKMKAAATIRNLGCSRTTSAATLACLRALPVSDFLSGDVYSQTTVDSKFVPQRPYALSGRGGTTNRVPMVIGFMRDEMASLGYVPPRTLGNIGIAMTNAGIVQRTQQIVLGNPDIFSRDIPNGVQNLTVSVQSYNGTGSRCSTPATAYAASRSGAFTDVWVYTQDQRAYQIPNWDPNGVCQPRAWSQAGNASAYYLCHSGDLLSTFATPMYNFGMGDRDGQDLDWMRNVVDQWTAFARLSDPNPTSAYLSARGYSGVQGDPWPKLDTSSGPVGSRMISLGPTQRDVPLAYSAAQCNKLGNGIQYIFRGGKTGDDYGALAMSQLSPELSAELLPPPSTEQNVTTSMSGSP